MFRELARRLSDATPAQCELCRAWPAEPVCAACRTRFATPVNRCGSCALAIPEGLRSCGRCTTTPPPLQACAAAVSYDYPWSLLVSRYKFAPDPGWAHTFVKILRDVPRVQALLAGASHVLPMPLSHERLRDRGFNQAHELARRLSLKADAGVLVRVRDTPAQAGLDLQARQSNVRHAFAIEPARRAELRGAHVVLVDDVMTTGASLFSLARTVLDAGAAHVSAIVFARTEEA
jgi:ComF family protein